MICSRVISCFQLKCSSVKSLAHLSTFDLTGEHKVTPEQINYTYFILITDQSISNSSHMICSRVISCFQPKCSSVKSPITRFIHSLLQSHSHQITMSSHIQIFFICIQSTIGRSLACIDHA